MSSASTAPGSRRHAATAPPHAFRLSTGAAQIVADIDNYLALGCLCFEDLLTAAAADDADDGGDARPWHEIRSLPSLAHDTTIASCLTKLLHAGWIRMRSSRCTYRPQWLIFRVYLLFQDVGLGAIDRSNRGLVAALGTVAQAINIEPRAWNGCYIPEEFSKFDLWATPERGGPSLFYLFNNLASPSPCATAVQETYDREALEDLLDAGYNLPGMKTTLYPYQRRSTGAMLQRESVSRLDLDPRLEQRRAPDGTVFYYAARDFRFFRDPQLWEAPRGGVLAEGMGLGKTVICLSLVLATKDHPPKIPKEYCSIPVRERVGSLADMAVSAANRSAMPWKVEFGRMRDNGQEMKFCEERFAAQPASYEIPSTRYRWNRNTSRPTPRHLTMASTTVIVVPPNLIKQWKREIEKHVVDGAIKLLVVDDRNVLLPSPQELRTYDIVLFTRNRFDLEDQYGQDEEERRVSKVPPPCTCSYIGATRTRTSNGLDEKLPYSSPLKKLHFKRLIVDEGHFFSAKNTTSTIRVAQNLVRADHRWVVSGTPAKDVLGVDIGLEDANSRNTLLDRRKLFDKKHDIAGAVESVSALASNLLMSTPWKANDAKNYIYRHEDFATRTYSGFSASFRRVLESIVIKTRPEDIDIEIPPYTQAIKRLAPSYYDKVTANLFTSVLTANAVTSERTDADYLYHKNSAKARYQLVYNLRQSAFFWTGFSEEDVEALIKNSTSYLGKEDTSCTPQDRALLSSTLQATKAVQSCKGWTAMSRSHELGAFVDDWPEQSAEHWAFDESTDPLLTGISQLQEAQRFVNQRIHLEDPGEGLSGLGIHSLSATRKNAVNVEEAEQGSPTGKDKPEKPILTKAGVPASSLTGEPSLKRRASMSDGSGDPSPRKRPTDFRVTKRRKTTHLRTNGEKPRSPALATNEQNTSDRAHPTASGGERLPEDSPYAWTRIVGTTSAKLSYLLSQVLEHCAEEKILVFYTSENSAYYLAQFLELFNVKHEIYAKSLSAEKKARYVEDFQEQDDLRVLLMDVGQAAFGLNICAASRIYFVNPICRPHLEAQAIKRAHRIGQSRKVTVETLVLQGSLEEKMLDRSIKMTQAEHQDAKVLEDDHGMQEIIQSARLLPFAEGETEPGVAQMAPLARPERLWDRPGPRESILAKPPSRRRKRRRPNDVTGVVNGDDHHATHPPPPPARSPPTSGRARRRDTATTSPIPDAVAGPPPSTRPRSPRASATTDDTPDAMARSSPTPDPLVANA